MDKPTQQSQYHKAISMYYEQDADETAETVVNSAKNDIKPTLSLRELIVLTVVIIGVILMGMELYENHNQKGIDYLDSPIQDTNTTNLT